MRTITLTDAFTNRLTLTVGADGRDDALLLHLIDVDGAELRLELDVLTTRAATLHLDTMSGPSESLDIEAWDGVQFSSVDRDIDEDGRPITRMFMSPEYPTEGGDGLTFYPYTDELVRALDELLGGPERIIAQYRDEDGYRVIAHRLESGTARIDVDSPFSTHVGVDYDRAALHAFARALLTF